MKRLLSLSFIFLFLGIFAAHFTVYTAYADDATTVKGSKSNSSERQAQPAPAPEPVEATTVKSTKSNTSERQAEPAPAPEPVEGTTKSAKSNSQEWLRAGSDMTDEATDGSGAATDAADEAAQ